MKINIYSSVFTIKAVTPVVSTNTITAHHEELNWIV